MGEMLVVFYLPYFTEEKAFVLLVSFDYSISSSYKLEVLYKMKLICWLPSHIRSTLLF